MQKELVDLPDINIDNVAYIYSQAIPYRKGGIRLEHEVINDKHIFHNYGHGAAGLSLSYGTSYMSAKSVTIHLDATTFIDCAVIGAGVNGLMTAIELAKRNRKVTLYSEIIPQLNSRKHQEVIASQVGPSVWMPIEYDWSQDLLKHQLSSKLAYDYLKECIDVKRYQSLKYINVYDKEHKIQDLKEVVSDFIFDNFKNVQIQYGTGQLQEAVGYKTINIDSFLFIEELKIEAILRGVKIVQRKFNNFNEILSLSENAIFNCTGLSSQYLFEDSNLQKYKGYVIQIHHKQPHKSEFVLKNDKKQPHSFDLHCFGNKTYILSYDKSQTPSQNKEIDKKEIRKILNQVNSFIKLRKQQKSKL